MFEVLNQFSDYGRSGRLTTRAGQVATPTFMPVGTRGVVKSVLPELLEPVGSQIVLANTYHLHLQPGEDVVAELGGLHEFMKWPKPILTDSGGFQVFSLAHTRKISEDGVTFKEPKHGDTIHLTPEKSIQIQIKLGSDIIMAFDDLTGLNDDDRARTKEAYERTHRWLKRSLDEFKRLTADMDHKPLFFGIAQGGLDESLRLKSLEFVQSLDVDGVAIGGLSVGETKDDMYRVLELLAPHYDPKRPHYLMGVGDPPDLRFAFDHGIDMADCVMPTRNARHGSVWIAADHQATDISGVQSDARLNLKSNVHTHDSQPIEPGCLCYACSHGYSRGWFRHQFKVNEPLAGTLASLHNIYYLEKIARQHRG